MIGKISKDFAENAKIQVKFSVCKCRYKNKNVGIRLEVESINVICFCDKV